jgi:hypothetical protein
MKNKSRRNPLDKPKHLLESTRAQWVAIGLIITLGVLVCNICFGIDPSPYLQSVMLLIGAGVLGWSVDSAVKAYRVNSDTSSLNERSEETYTENINRKEEVTIKHYNVKEDDYSTEFIPEDYEPR